MSCVAIIQARMSSERLPGKVLLPLRENEVVLDAVVRRMKKSKYINEVVVATSTEPSDDEIVSHCTRRNYPVYRGSLKDVLGRYYQVSRELNAQTVVRVTADCPLIDWELTDRIIEMYNSENQDYVGVQIGTLALGLATEVFSSKCLGAAFIKAVGADREHVTSYIYKHPEEHKCYRLKPSNEYLASVGYRLTLDTYEDYQVIKAVYEGIPSDYITISEVVEFLKAKPDIGNLNKHVIQKG